MCVTLEEQMETARSMIKDHDRIACFLGVGMGIEAGLPNLWGNEMAYYAEEKYGYSPEEMYSATFYNTRPAQFYYFYQDVYLKKDFEPTIGYHSVQELQKRGKVSGCVTQSVWGLSLKAGIANVIELHGNVHTNWCPKCKHEYSLDYVRDYEGVPLCEHCKSIVRPGVVLGGEQVRNDRMTQAANLVSGADMLLILGTNMNDNMVKWGLEYFEGDKILVISKNIHFSDKRADLTINGEVQEILPKII